MSDRAGILARLRAVAVEATPLPELAGDWTTSTDPAAWFGDVLASVGGDCRAVADHRALAAGVEQLCRKLAATRVVSEVDGVAGALGAGEGGGSVAPSEVQLAIVRGEWAVAENAAVWVSDAMVTERATLFLSEHVALVVDRERLLSNMHEAYERIDVAACRFGAFISGPSKTADIEQALVIGAHGPRSLTVFLVG